MKYCGSVTAKQDTELQVQVAFLASYGTSPYGWRAIQLRRLQLTAITSRACTSIARHCPRYRLGVATWQGCLYPRPPFPGTVAGGAEGLWVSTEKSKDKAKSFQHTQ